VYGDEHVVRREFLGVVPYRHHGIELPGGRIAENSPPGTRIVGFDDFARGRPTRIITRDLSLAGRDQAVERALSRVGERRYSLGGWNCEHFASWCATGVAYSQQVADAMAAFLAFLKAAIVAGAAVLAVIVLEAALAE
jgi:Lecithin retinol acyltransferase